MQDLRPCPFCGGDAEVRASNRTITAVYVRCISCSAAGPITCPGLIQPLSVGDYDVNLDGIESYKRRAIDAWNKRKD